MINLDIESLIKILETCIAEDGYYDQPSYAWHNNTMGILIAYIYNHLNIRSTRIEELLTNLNIQWK